MTDNPSRELLESHELAEAGPPEAVRLPLDLVDGSPVNPRRVLIEVDALADSIADPNIGLIHPIAVRRKGERYEVLSGHRRLAAFRLLGEREPWNVAWRTVPATIRTADDEQAYLTLISAQTHSRSWTPREEASVLEGLATTRTLAAVGALIHMSVPWVSTRLKVYADAVLSPLVQLGRLDATTATELVSIKDPSVRKAMADQAVAERWTQAETRRRVRALRLDAQLRELARRVHEMLAILAVVQPGQIPMSTARDLQVLSGRIQVLARGGPVLPSIEAAEKAAGIRPNAQRPQTKRKRRTLPSPS